MKTINCNEMLSSLDELVDGVLGEQEAAGAQSHIEACPSCRDEYESAVRLQSATKSLSQSAEPERDLWPGIADQIEDRRVVRADFERPPVFRARTVWMAAAAAAILVISVSVAYRAGLEQGQPRTAQAPPVESSYVQAAYGDPGTGLELARDQLLSSLEERQNELSPETWSVVMDNLQVIDNAIARIEIALADHPNDGRLNRQLAMAYRQQINLLQRATRLPAEV
jgi:Putative zinc-finger